MPDFAAIVAHLLEGVLVSDERGTILYANVAAGRLFGYESALLIGQNVSCLVPEPHGSQHDRYMVRFQETGIARVVGIPREVEGLRRDGRVIPIVLSLSYFRQQERLFFVALVRDNSRTRQRERELQLAREEADRAARVKDLFLANMSHELRTPLNVILGYSQLLEASFAHEGAVKRATQIGHVLRAGEHLLKLINDVLILSRIGADQLPVHFENVDAVELAWSLTEDLRMAAAGEEIAIHFTCGADRVAGSEELPLYPLVQADRTRLTQVLTNLLSNAVKYNRPGGTVTVGFCLIGGDRLRITVADTGIGIPEDKQGDVFKPFARLGAEERGIDGSGIGLALCRHLVELMNGGIGFESQSGEGSLFWVELPLAHDFEEGPETMLARAAEWAAEEASGVAGGVAGSSTGGLTGRDRRRFDRHAFPVFSVAIEGKVYQTGNVSLDGLMISNYDGSHRQGEVAIARFRSSLFSFCAAIRFVHLDPVHKTAGVRFVNGGRRFRTRLLDIFRDVVGSDKGSESGYQI
jgi:PAS domain S-box-containing protein